MLRRASARPDQTRAARIRRGERTRELVDREVKRVVRLVEKDAPAIRDHGKHRERAREVGHVRRRDLDALGTVRRAGREDHVLRLIIRDPPLTGAGHQESLLQRCAAQEGTGVEQAGRGQKVRETPRDVVGREQRGLRNLARDVTDARGRELHVDERIGVPAHEAAEKRRDGERLLVSQDDHGALARHAVHEDVRERGRLGPQRSVRRGSRSACAIAHGLGPLARGLLDSCEQGVRLAHACPFEGFEFIQEATLDTCATDGSLAFERHKG